MRKYLPALRAALALAALAGLVVAFLALVSPDRSTRLPEPLWQKQVPAWTAALGGEEAVSQADLDNFSRFSFGLSPEDASQALRVTTLAAVSQLTSEPTGYVDFDPPDQGTAYARNPRCKDTTILAGSVVGERIEGSLWAKAAFVFTGQCADATYTEDAVGVEYAYAELVEGTWVPRRVWQTPGANDSVSVFDTDPGSLVSTTCPQQSDGVLARPAVASAFDALCSQAASEGVNLAPVSGYRTRQQQERRFNEAVKVYGSAQAAAQWVSYADDRVCTSRFCQGWAVGVDPGGEGPAWLASSKVCLSDSGQQVPVVTEDGSRSCPEGSVPVSRAQEFGFATPSADLPGYLEYVLPAGLGPGGKVEANCEPYGMPAAAAIAAVFRCRLAQVGVVGPPADEVVATALSVAQCSSGLNPQATVFDGAYVSEAEASTGRTFPLGGLFGLAPAPAAWQSGDLGDPVANANYAAKLWLADRSFSRFFCATGQDEALASQGVDPAFSPEVSLPEWTRDW